MFAFFGSPGVIELLILAAAAIAVIVFAMSANSKRRDD